jgi:uncharacterized protein
MKNDRLDDLQSASLFPGREESAREESERSGPEALLKPKKTIQLAASGPVMITELERMVIDTRDFQRLRGVRQLGTACYVYPTALHTRFDHSLGTLQMVSEMIRLIRTNQHSEDATQKRISTEQEIVTRLYALLHDVTHIPLGHTIEDELQILQRHDENDERIDRFLGPKSEIGAILISQLGQELHRKLLEIYRWDDKDPDNSPIDPDWAFVHDLVSNTVCADLLDYIRRDDFFCNLGVGMRYQFLNYLYLDRERHVHNAQTPRMRAFVRVSKGEGVPRRDILSDLCRLMEARYLIAERVYFHHAKIIVGTMLGRAIQEHVFDALDGNSAAAEEWMCRISDQELLTDLERSPAALAATLAKMVSRRELYTTVASYDGAHKEAAQSQNRNVSVSEHFQQLVGKASERRSVENELAEIILAEPGDVLVYAPPGTMNLKIARMRVLWNGEHRTFKEIDDPIVQTRLNAVEEAHRKLWSIRLIARRTLSQDQVSRLRRYFKARFFDTDPSQSKSACERVLREVVDDFMVANNVRQPENPKARRDQLEAVLADLGAQFHGGKGSFKERLVASVQNRFGWSPRGK